MNLRIPRCGGAILVGSLALFALAPRADAATLSRSVVVHADAARVWAQIGPFCAIGTWHPAVASCWSDGAAAPTRTLVIKDGKGVFVERQVARDEAHRSYAYSFTSSPVPVTGYQGTIQVTPMPAGYAKVTWRSAYTPDAGRADEARAALTGIYDLGLSAIQSSFGP
jgi:hypothetical protein